MGYSTCIGGSTTYCQEMIVILSPYATNEFTSSIVLWFIHQHSLCSLVAYANHPHSPPPPTHTHSRIIVLATVSEELKLLVSSFLPCHSSAISSIVSYIFFIIVKTSFSNLSNTVFSLAFLLSILAV